ncbi:glutamine amidotransferase [Phreatobacter stygius]|uniref:Glutamine amidotransferase n=1 Tax=Phreatobacter stygius TaxID=1940610 RepID=A0A4D7BE86_9HYPH|nr:glutamine amidotransferase [Phreatobacter stygius]QCI66247.1 glutamine amidotransferase [Phreatobacter stygius]
MSLPTAVAIRHVAFEDLGSLALPIERAGYKIHYYDVGLQDLWTLDPIKTELLVVLGGPIGAYQDEQYPFLKDEIGILQERLAAGRPTLGLGLGAQLMARALGARVYPAPQKEIGWSPIMLSEAGRPSAIRHLGDAPVLHWHGDTFDLPPECELIASTGICRNQGFMKGPNILGLQFHPEAVHAGFERWLVGHASELSQAEIDPKALRAQAARHAAGLQVRARDMMDEWLQGLG